MSSPGLRWVQVQEQVGELEYRSILAALVLGGWRMTYAAQILGITRGHLQSLIRTRGDLEELYNQNRPGKGRPRKGELRTATEPR